jgi:RimJ/RimL family protein N-acetyltransferase
MTAALDSIALDLWVSEYRTRRGDVVCIRPLRPDDREREIAYINSLSERSRHFRLFTPLRTLPRHLVEQLMDVDYRQRMAFVATTHRSGSEQIVGVARYGVADEQDAAEFAVSVADAWQRCGVAGALMKQLSRYAGEQGIRRLTGLILPDNRAMIALARRLGFTVRYDPAQHLFVCSGLTAERQAHLDQVGD